MVYYQENQSAYNIKKSKVNIQNRIEKQKNSGKTKKATNMAFNIKGRKAVIFIFIYAIYIAYFLIKIIKFLCLNKL